MWEKKLWKCRRKSPVEFPSKTCGVRRRVEHEAFQISVADDGSGRSDSDPERRFMRRSGFGSSCVLNVQRSTGERQLGSDPRRWRDQQSQRSRSRCFQSLPQISRRQIPSSRVHGQGLASIVPPYATYSSNSIFLVPGNLHSYSSFAFVWIVFLKNI